ncbi:ImmA/IrrE family metallo-endopeptidase [Daejeonella lutea]|uniref:IrrE N-terminal-like domain-containing protein n=1 Tax=Daejeonella lutea TaxID=572036 RepID=A0A1T5CXH6_9SPHI|nr:ImmA/IrrE family metallo-endopeptidase [Daejeonella lutea]SKB64047.1 protein of unknown function [Daejeonella lutea]
MAAGGILKRGFKAKADRISSGYRTNLGLADYSPLCAFALAEHLSIPVFKASEFFTQSDQLLRMQAEDFGWSALTMKTLSGKTIIIHNPYSSIARQQSDVMHELAHIICEHSFETSEVGFSIPIGMRTFNEVYEEEAKCLGACLQITRSGLLWGLKKNMSNLQLANHFNASVEMVNYRIRMTGVLKQLSYHN